MYNNVLRQKLLNNLKVPVLLLKAVSYFSIQTVVSVDG